MVEWVFRGAVFSGAQAARSLRVPWTLVQRCARPGGSPIDLSRGTGGAQRTTNERLRVQP